MDKLAEYFTELSKQYGPVVADAAKSAARIEAFSTLVNGIMCLCISAALWWASWFLYQKITVAHWDEMIWLPICLLALAGGIIAAIGIWSWVDPWTWVAIARPELWIAKKAFHI